MYAEEGVASAEGDLKFAPVRSRFFDGGITSGAIVLRLRYPMETWAKKEHI